MNQAAAESSESKAALVFDADTITLTGKFVDELSAYRARKEWHTALSSHFLLEKGRDFDSKVTVSTDGEVYTLKCSFSSACGRYAFWRLVNHQAPEVEEKLQSSDLVNKKTARFLLGSIWNNQAQPLESRLQAVEDDVRETTSVITSLIRYFKQPKSPR